MALIYDGKTFRNLEEQVRKNKQDISNLEKIQTVLNEFGIHVIGKVDDETQLPASSSAFGNAYAVGIQAPYEYYIWTDLQPTPGWLNIGIFPAPSNVQGPQGKEGTSVTAASVVDGYLVLTLTDADGNETQLTAGYVKGSQGVQGPRGLQGLQGIQGEQGEQGLTGAQGPRGYTGFALDIISLLSSTSELPDPNTGDRHDAYVVQTGDDFELYGKVYDDGTDSFSWENFGLIAFSTNYVTAAQLQAKLDDELEAFIDWVDTDQNPNQLTFYNNYSGNEVTEIDFARINGNPIVGVVTNFQLTTKTELSSFQSALILGTFEVAIAKETKAIKALSNESGETQTEPFIIQGTGTANNTVKVDTSKVAELKAKAISTVEVNQYLESLPATQTINGITYTNNGDGSYTINGTATERSVCNIVQGGNIGYFNSTHKLYISMVNNITGGVKVGNTWYGISEASVITVSESGNLTDFWIAIANGITMNNSEYVPVIIDLTQWFGSNDDIPQGLLDHPENFGNYYTGSLAYNTGTQKSSDGVYLCCGGRNAWDEEWESGRFIWDTGAPYSDPTAIRSKNYNRIIGGSQYYNKGAAAIFLWDVNFNYIGYKDSIISNIPSNAYWFKICTQPNYGATYNNDITISLYYSTGEGYDKHYPYVEPVKYNLSGALPSVIEIEDYGTMWWEDINNELIEIAQGLTVFYPADYVGFIDSLSKHLNGNASSVSTLPMLPETSSDGTYVLKATKSGSTITYTWVLES